MKTKKFKKKLVLSKQTIVNLDNEEMNKLKVGDQNTLVLPTCGGRTCDLTGDPCIQCFSVWPVVLSVCICEH
jgi:hypothetical protein